MERSRVSALVALAAIVLVVAAPQPAALPALAAGGPTYRVHLPLIQHQPVLIDVVVQAAGAASSTFLNSPGTITALMDEAAACRLTRRYGLRLVYAFAGQGNGGWIVSWESVTGKPFNASSYDRLTLWARGTAPDGFQVGLKDTGEREGKIEAKDYLAVSDTAWRRMSVPLSRFADARGPVSIASVRNVNIGFNASHGAGNLCVDVVSFGGPLDDVFLLRDGGQPFNYWHAPGSLAAVLSQEAGCRHSGDYGLQLSFAFSADGFGGWGVEWSRSPFQFFDASPFTELVFWVKGTAPNGFQIGLKDVGEHEVKVEARSYVAVAAGAWSEVRVPLVAFADASGAVDLARVRNLNFGFNRDHAAGIICVDDVSLE